MHLQQIADLMWQASKATFSVVATQKFKFLASTCHCVYLQQQSVTVQHDIVHLQQIADLMWQASKQTFSVVATQKFTVVCESVPLRLFATTKRCHLTTLCECLCDKFK